MTAGIFLQSAEFADLVNLRFAAVRHQFRECLISADQVGGAATAKVLWADAANVSK